MESLDGLDPKVKFRLYRFSVWCGLFVVIGNTLAFNVWGDIFPPPDPGWGPDRVAQFILGNREKILWSVVLMGFVAPFFYFFAVVTSLQMRRIEGGMGLLSYVQLTSAVVAPTGWVYPLCLLATAAYRPERNPDLILALSDQYYLTMIGVAFIFSINIASIGLAAIFDRRAQPVFPKWFGYANIVFAIIFAPGIFVYAYLSGPFAWNGTFALKLPMYAFPFWKAMMIWGLLRAIRSEEAEESAAALIKVRA
jgi:hypothetical protein